MFRELTIFLNITPWAWETLGVVAVLAVFGFVFRMRKIGVSQREWREMQAIVNEAETNIEPHDVVNSRPIESSKLEREWALNHDWLTAYWDDEIRRFASGALPPDHSWRMSLLGGNEFSSRLGEQSFSGRIPMTKGQMVDLLGLVEPLDEEQQQILKFFETSSKRRFSRTTAAREIRWIFESKTNCAMWGMRPATPMQRVFFEHVGVAIPKEINAVAAETMIKQCLNDFGNKREKCLDDWLSLESMCNELCNPDIALHYAMRTPAPQDASALYIRLDVVAQRLLKNQPRLRVRTKRKRTPALLA